MTPDGEQMNTLPIILAVLAFIMVGQIHEAKQIIIPLTFSQELDKTKLALAIVGCPPSKVDRINKAIKVSSVATGISELLLVCLMKTESEFVFNCTSPKAYKGLMQTPKATMSDADLDTLIGAKILTEKLNQAKGDISLALALYKGGNNKQAHQQAKAVLTLYAKVQKQLNNRTAMIKGGTDGG
jgi:soluble lytic murein transglycosylase-like protein